MRNKNKVLLIILSLLIGTSCSFGSLSKFEINSKGQYVIPYEIMLSNLRTSSGAVLKKEVSVTKIDSYKYLDELKEQQLLINYDKRISGNMYFASNELLFVTFTFTTTNMYENILEGIFVENDSLIIEFSRNDIASGYRYQGLLIRIPKINLDKYQVEVVVNE